MASERPPPGVLENVLVADGSVHGAFHGVFFQVRRGPLTEADLGRIHAAGFRHRARFPRDQRQGMLLLTEPGALIPDESVRLRQRTIVNDLLKDPRIRMAVVIVGEDIDATMLRSVSRGVVRTHPQLHLFSEADDACTWLAREIGASPVDLTHALREARAYAARTLG